LDTIFNSPSSDAPASSTPATVSSSESDPTPTLESSPVKADPEKVVEEKSPDTTATLTDGEKTTVTTPEAQAADAKSAADKAAEAKSAAAKAATEADAKAAQEVTFEKRWKDTVSWANQLKQENSQMVAAHRELLKQVETLKKQIADPEYDPATDPANQGPSSEDIASQALIVGKTVASRNSANQTYGKEQVDNALTHFHGIFKNDALVQQRVQQSESPIHEAINQVERHYFEEKYGNTPSAMYAAIEKEVTDKQRASLRKEILDEIKTGKSKKSGVVEGLSSSRGSSGIDRSENAKNTETPLTSIFS
jgi:hypothetical protein